LCPTRPQACCNLGAMMSRPIYCVLANPLIFAER
jgi:hypothetical protein